MYSKSEKERENDRKKWGREREKGWKKEVREKEEK